MCLVLHMGVIPEKSLAFPLPLAKSDPTCPMKRQAWDCCCPQPWFFLPNAESDESQPKQLTTNSRLNLNSEFHCKPLNSPEYLLCCFPYFYRKVKHLRKKIRKKTKQMLCFLLIQENDDKARDLWQK